MGAILGCRSAAVAMAAGMSVGRSPLLRFDRLRTSRDVPMSIEDMKHKNVLDERNRLFGMVGGSDHAFLAAVYQEWESSSSRKRLCDQLGLNFPVMQEFSKLANQLDSALDAAGYKRSDASDRHSSSWRIVRACTVASMAPSQLVKIVRPAATYQQTSEGAVEKDGEARALQFFIRNDGIGLENASAGRAKEERVFIHPTSGNFTSSSFSCPWLVFHALVRTSKPFLRDVTECSAYSLLLFGGDLEVQASKNIIFIDGWAAMSANGRIGTLVGGLRRKMDDLMLEKVRNPALEIEDTNEMKLIVKLLKTDGLGV